ncbi:MAG TPA: DUF3667 domain-containing protein [Candidatus Angelobacter sp.]|jgi:hypothetical protein
MTELSTNRESSLTETAHPHPPACADCGAPLYGPFCSRCGEHVIDRHSLTLWHFLKHNLLHELSHVDGKIFRTFHYLLFRPGFLTAEYFVGRQQRYINPVRLLLTCLVILALLPDTGVMQMTISPGRFSLRLNLLPPGPPVSGKIDETIRKLDVFGIVNKMMEKKAQQRNLEAEASVEKFNHELKTYATALSFSNVILLALFLALFYHKRRPLFVEHLVFSLHLASFVVLFSAVPGPLFAALVRLAHGSAVNIIGGVLAFTLISAQVIYLYKAMLRFYWPEAKAQTHWWSRAAWTARLAVFAIFFANSIFITLIYAAGAAIALWRV